MEQGKHSTTKRVFDLMLLFTNTISEFNECESRAMTYELMIISEGGTGSSHLNYRKN